MLKQRMKGFLSRNKSDSGTNSTNNFSAESSAADSPEANVTRAIRLFCESGSNNNGGEEVLHLPVIVEAAESSPSAAANAASQIRTFLGKDWSKKPHVQYNAIMLIRILCDNPGPTFTRNFDKSFVSTVKELVRNSKDLSTVQIMRETLDALEVNKANDENLQGLIQMWRKEKGNNASLAGNRASHFGGGQPVTGNVGGNGPHRGRQLPDTVELASRVEEAKNTAKILLQLVSSTPETELLNSELIKEFNQRCQSAQRSMQGYINCDNPSPDHDTMQTLIETNEQLSLATSRYQRATLSARRTLGVASASPPVEPIGHSAFAPPPGLQSMPAPVVPQQEQTTSAFGNSNSNGAQGLPAPLIPQQQQQSTSAFGSAGGVYQGYQAPSGPPPSQRIQQQSEPADNPFIDPSERQTTSQRPHSQSFNIDSGAILAPHQPKINAQTTGALENAYASPGGLNAHPPASERSPVSPQSPPRPPLGADRQSDITQSYVGRQQSAANGFTMHGAGDGGQQGGGGSITDRGRGY
ncbi:unnamed protein product [Zymoseptoria tritici ST99CH_1A5]|uniref:GAT domain-containing protein n=1 Tax=Zymoseptoria tritici ST99CH_1A5 TaxID=1276529 RepID=A0A1Y6L9S9_ZYMTR|nr:unnamed protein product [Zymoseptoria tritici ST99CH_1A5]